MDKSAVRRLGRGRPSLRRRRVEPVIPTRKDQPRQPDFRKGRLPGTQQGRATDQPARAVSPQRHPLRKAGHQLPHHGHPRHDHALTHVSLQRRPSRSQAHSASGPAERSAWPSPPSPLCLLPAEWTAARVGSVRTWSPSLHRPRARPG